jgi:hypothetical protein
MFSAATEQQNKIKQNKNPNNKNNFMTNGQCSDKTNC